MKRLFVTAMLLLGFALPLTVSTATVGAVDVFDACRGGATDTAVCKGRGDKILGADGILANVINLLLTIIGIVAVIMIIVGGIRYTTSGGDSGQINSARDTIIYAVVGLVLAIMAFALVNWVLGRL